MIFRTRLRLISALTLTLFCVQGLSPIFNFSHNPLLIDAAYCGTRIDNPGTDVVVIRAPLIDETPSPANPLPAKPVNEHCSLCYIHTPSLIVGYTGSVTTSSDKISATYFSSIPNNSLQQQHLELLAPTHAPPRFA